MKLLLRGAVRIVAVTVAFLLVMLAMGLFGFVLEKYRVPLGPVSLDGIVEIFNLFNRANYGSFELDETSPRFGEPNSSSNLAYAPRTLQIGFRLAF